MGARVIKIETPRVGDYMRMAPAELGFEELFQTLNQGKESLAVNFRNPAGREIVLKLIAEADIVIESFKPGTTKKWKLGYDDVRQVNDQIIYCSLSAFGQFGADSDRPGHDLNLMGLSGLLFPDAIPDVPKFQFADIGSAMLATLAIVAAVVKRGRDGTGSYIDVSLFDAPILWNELCRTETAQSPLTGAAPCYNV